MLVVHLKAKFLCGDAVVKEMDLYKGWEPESFVKGERGNFEEFDESFELKRLEAEYGCQISVRLVPVLLEKDKKLNWWTRILYRASSFFNF